MSLGSELFSLAIYVVQELGIVVAVGAQTVFLAAYLLSIHSEKDEHTALMRACKYLVALGLVAIAASGAAAVALHLLNQQYDILFAPAFIFKWMLILATASLYIVDDDWVSHQPRLAQASAKGLSGGLWYGMLLIHLVAPVIQWMPLLLLFVSWMLVFVTLWSAFVAVMHWQSPVAKAARAERAKLQAEERAKAQALAAAQHEQETHQTEVAKQQEEKQKAEAAAKLAQEAQRKAAEEKKNIEDEATRKANEEAKQKAALAAAELAKKKEAEAAEHAKMQIVPVPPELPPHIEPPKPIPPPPPPKPVPPKAPAPVTPTAPVAKEVPKIPGVPEPTTLPTIRVMPRTPEELAKHQ